MDWLLQAAIILGMFILRLGVPLLLTLGVGAWLRRLDAKWQAEALTQQDAVQTQEEVVVELELVGVKGQPCWILRDCPETVRLRCPAFQQPRLPCWLARRRAEGRLPLECYQCELFSSLYMAPSVAS